MNSKQPILHVIMECGKETNLLTLFTQRNLTYIARNYTSLDALFT